MRISTAQLYGRPATLMTQLTAEADKVQMQIATGRIHSAPSDDASAYLRLQSLRRAGADDGAYSSNITLAQGLLAQTDTALDSVESELLRALELATQAATGTLSDIDRAAIGKEIESIRDALFALANSKDTRGEPMFGGMTGDTAYVRAADGSIAYAGSGEPAAIPVGPGISIQGTVPGDRVFASSGGNDIFAVLATLSSALAGGGDASGAAGDALEGIKATADQVSLARASVGARAARLDLDAERLVDAGESREIARSAIDDTDIPTAVAELQKTLTVLQATQASFTKLSSLSLFDYLR